MVVVVAVAVALIDVSLPVLVRGRILRQGAFHQAPAGGWVRFSEYLWVSAAAVAENWRVWLSAWLSVWCCVWWCVWCKWCRYP